MMRLLATLPTSPAPRGPRWKTLALTASRSGRSASMAAASPPQRSVSVPAAAPATPPLTGQSITATPRARARSAMGISSDRAMVLQTMMAPPVIVSSRPSGPLTTAATWAPLTTITIALRHSAPICAGSRAARPPRAVKRARGSGATSYASTSWPALRRFEAIPKPI